MKDKFNYTATSRILYKCPCCLYKWRGSKKDYCPNCEVKLLYSAGEEVNIKEQIKNDVVHIQDTRDEKLAELYYHRGYQKGHDDANTRPTASEKWINVEDRLPEPETYVVCWIEHHQKKMDVCFYSQKNTGVKDLPQKGYFLFDSHPQVITHWMPLPKQPLRN